MHRVVMPRIDPGMQTGYLVQWIKREGDSVQKGEAVAIGEGEKTTFDIVAPEAGVVRKILCSEKSEVPVTETIALIGEANEPLPEMASPVSQTVAHPLSSSPASTTIESEGGFQAVSPAARRLAKEHGVDLSRLRGSGPGGRITREDVQREIAHAASSRTEITRAPSAMRVVSQTKLSQTRRTIAERLGYSHQTIPSASILMEVQMDMVLHLKERLELSGQKISLTAVLVKALSQALAEDKTFNSSLEGDSVQTYDDVNVAVAIQGSEGLVAPVIRQAGGKSVGQISEEIATLTDKANQRRLNLEELTGSTVTISNLGPFGADAFVPIINPPNAMILGVGQIAQRPRMVGNKVEMRPYSTLSLVFDHRIGDGAAASKLLSRIKRLLEEPVLLGA